MFREAERTASAARETASELVDAAEASVARAEAGLAKKRKVAADRLGKARAGAADADDVWREQCRALCEGVGLLLRALVHSRRTGWVRAWRSGRRDDGVAARLRAFTAAAPLLACTDETFDEFAELQDYLVACHSTCAPADYLWEHLAGGGDGD